MGVLLFLFLFMMTPAKTSQTDIIEGYKTTVSLAASPAVFMHYVTNIRLQTETAKKQEIETNDELSKITDGLFGALPVNIEIAPVSYPPGIVPVQSYINGWGAYNVNSRHLGADFSPNEKGLNEETIPVYSAMDGKYSGVSTNYMGEVSFVTQELSNAGINASNVTLVYAHLQKDSLPKATADVKSGQTVGNMGTTGGVARHLHLELWVKVNEVWRIYNPYSAIYEKKPLAELPYLFSSSADPFTGIRSVDWQMHKPQNSNSGTGGTSV
jgi:murein DD-endopeptidase MepM/ murein hydrolase activator NlpD